MDLAISTDYFACTACPEPALRAIAAAGFTHVHWCHHWSSDFLYGEAEMAQIAGWIKGLGLRVQDIHGSTGQEKNWVSARPYERQAGVELVKNRMVLCERLGGDVVVQHMPRDARDPAFRRSLDELEPFARERGVRLALENGDPEAIASVLREHDPAYLGFCYDSGHERLGGVNPAHRAALKDRLIAVHLDDNTKSDDHQIPFDGLVDWPGVIRFLASSSYTRCLTLEATIHGSGIEDPAVFLRRAHDAGERLTGLLAAARARA